MSTRDDFTSGDTLDASSSGDATVDASVAPRAARAGDYAALLAVDPAHYILAGELARGGMGRIVRAHDRRLGRDVAIKELLAGHDDVRFEREARITARLAHPAIVAIHEAGRWPSGEPFFAMKLVAGMSLDKKLAATAGFAERLALVPSVITAVDALAYAHSEQVIHRDLKPANILVGKFGETVVIDWGLAKDLASDLVDDLKVGPYRGDEGATVVGSVMGTPAYMPPEQAEGERVDERADVYALGALLYHVLAGAPPYEGKSVDTVLALVLAGPPQPLAARVPEAPIELVAIVERAMAREVTDRFPSAQEMADELRRFQTGQLVQSHRYTAGELVRRWLRRHRAPVAVGGVAFATLAILGVASVAKIVAETHRADREAETSRSRADRGTLDRARGLLDRDPTAALAALAELSPGAPEWRAARTLVADARARGTARVLHGDGAPIYDLVWSADGAYLAALQGGEAIVWDLATGVKARLILPAGDDFRTIAWDGDALVHIDWYGRLGRWQPMTGVDVQLARGYEQNMVDLAPGGRWVAVVDGDRNGQLVDVATGAPRSIGAAADIAWDADGQTLLAWDSTQLRRIDAASGRTVATLPMPDFVHRVASVRGVGFAIERGVLHHLGGRGVMSVDPVSTLAVLADGRAVFAATSAGTIESSEELVERGVESIVTIADGSHTGIELRGHHAAITALATSLTGALASADYTSEVRIWIRTPVDLVPGEHAAYGAFLEPDRTHLQIQEHEVASRVDLATGARKNVEPLLDLGGRAILYERDKGFDPDRRLALRGFAAAPRARRWMVIDHLHHAWQWDADSGARELCEDTDLVAISADGEAIATFDHGKVHVWDPATGEGFDVAASSDTKALAVSPDHQLVAAGDVGMHLVLYRDRMPERIELPKQRAGVSTLAFDATGAHLAAAFDTDIYVIDLATRAPRLLRGHDGPVLAVQWLADGRLVSTSSDLSVRVWNLGDASVKILRGHTKPVLAVDVVGDAAMTVARDGTARLWDVAAEIGRPLLGHDAAPIFAGFGAAGEVLVLDGDGRLSHYRDDTPIGEAALRVWIAAITGPATPR